MKQTYLNLDFSDIQKAYPKAVDDVVEWFCSREDIIQGLVGMGGDMATKSEIMVAMKQVVPMIIQYDPRKLYDFFDDKGIIISVAQHDEDMFTVYNNISKHSVPGATRSEAEKIGFHSAFEVLEKQLSNESPKGGVSEDN